MLQMNFLPPSSMLKIVRVVLIQILLNINHNAWCHIPQDDYFIFTPVKTSVLKAKTCMRYKNDERTDQSKLKSRAI